VLERGAIDWSRILHGEEEYTFYGRPPAAGETLTARQEVVDVFAKAGRRGGDMKFIIVRTEYRNAAGDLVADVRHTVIETSKAAT
jgi:acyl dehydratase